MGSGDSTQGLFRDSRPTGYFFFLVFLRLYSLFYYITRYRANTLIYGLFRTPFVINSRSRNHSRKVTQNCYHHPPDSTRIRY